MPKRKRGDRRVKHEDTSGLSDDSSTTPVSTSTSGPTNPQLGQSLTRAFNKIKALKDNGRARATQFLQIPPKKYYPDYYEIITRPISLNEIGNKASSGAYKNEKDFIADFALMAKNATTYNDPASEIAIDAQIMLDMAKRLVSEMSASDANSVGAELRKAENTIIDDLIEYKVKGRRLSDLFMTEPSKEEYPMYYKIIKKATSLMTIRRQIEQGRAQTIDVFVDLVDLMFSNAKLFNESGSIVYNDAITLEKLFKSKIAKLRERFPDLSSASSLKLVINQPAASTASAPTATAATAAPKLKLSLKKKEDEVQAAEPIAASPSPAQSHATPTAQNVVSDVDDSQSAPSPQPPISSQQQPNQYQQQLPSGHQFPGGQQYPQGHPYGQQQQGYPPYGGAPGQPPYPMDPMGMGMGAPPVIQDIEHRRVGKGVGDALLTCVDLYSVVSSRPQQLQQAYPYPTSDVSDMFQMVIPASKSHVISSYSLSLPNYHHTLNLSVLLNPTLYSRYFNLAVLHQNRRVMPASAQNQQNDSRERFELRLVPGLNHVTVNVTASGLRNTMNPQQEPGEVTDMEKITLWVNLARWPHEG